MLRKISNNSVCADQVLSSLKAYQEQKVHRAVAGQLRNTRFSGTSHLEFGAMNAMKLNYDERQIPNAIRKDGQT